MLVPELLETWNFARSMIGAQLEDPQYFRSNAVSQAEI